MKFYGELSDNEFEYDGIEHERIVSRGILINDDNKIALLKIEGLDEFGYRDYYETPGGGVENKESLIKAAKREIKEETGYDSKFIKSIGYVIDYYNLIKRKNITYYHIFKAKKYVGSSLEDYEKGLIKNIKFYSIDECIDLYKNHMNSKVGKIVQNRELRIFLDVKKWMEKENENKKI